MTNAIWLLIAYFVMSAVGSWLSRQAKKSQQSGRSRPGRPDASREAEEAQGPGQALGEPMGRPARTDRQSPEDIAAEIRRVMGLERAETRVEVIEEVYEPALESSPYDFDPEPSFDADADADPDHGGGLHDRFVARESAARAPGAHRLGDDISERHAGSGDVGRLADRFAAHAVPRGSVARRRGYLDISDMARAFVTMEVLGKPKALRDDESY
jgi:hypothetical protein